MAKTSRQPVPPDTDENPPIEKSATMAKRGGKGKNGEQSVSSYFRKFIEERPELLDSKSNAELLDQWLKDHPGHSSVPKKIKQNLANVKSILRKKRRYKSGGKRAGQASYFFGTRSEGLEGLEENIDECLTLAKNLDRIELANIINLLRQARNEVVWKMGQ